MTRIISRILMLPALVFGFMGTVFAQTPATQDGTAAQPPAATTPSAVGAGAIPDLSLVGKLEGRRMWLNASTRAQSTAGIKIEEVKIENGKGTGLLTGYAATGYAGSDRCSHVADVPAVLTLDSSGVLTVVADSGTCGIWQYTLHRDTPTHFKGRHRVNPTEIELDFTPR
jgi:hypothetical protein